MIAWSVSLRDWQGWWGNQLCRPCFPATLPPMCMPVDIHRGAELFKHSWCVRWPFAKVSGIQSLLESRFVSGTVVSHGGCSFVRDCSLPSPLRMCVASVCVCGCVCESMLHVLNGLHRNVAQSLSPALNSSVLTSSFPLFLNSLLFISLSSFFPWL